MLGLDLVARFTIIFKLLHLSVKTLRTDFLLNWHMFNPALPDVVQSGDLDLNGL